MFIIIIIVICDRDSWARASGCTFVELHGQCYKNTAAPDGVRGPVVKFPVVFIHTLYILIPFFFSTPILLYILIYIYIFIPTNRYGTETVIHSCCTHLQYFYLFFFTSFTPLTRFMHSVLIICTYT